MMIQVSGGKMDEKRNQLKEFLLSQGSMAVAFSGGVDSTFLCDHGSDRLSHGKHE